MSHIPVLGKVNTPLLSVNELPKSAAPSVSACSQLDAIGVASPVNPVVNLHCSDMVIPLVLITVEPTVKVPVVVRLSQIVTSEVVCPIVNAIPDVSVAIFKAPTAFVMYEFDPS